MLVENFLSEENINGITERTSSRSHHGDDGVFFDIERPRIELKGTAKDLERLGWDKFGPGTAYPVVDLVVSWERGGRSA